MNQNDEAPQAAGDGMRGGYSSGSTQLYAGTKTAQNVLDSAAAAIGILPEEFRRINAPGARSLVVGRLREIEGSAEVLARQMDALETFLQAIDGRPEGER